MEVDFLNKNNILYATVVGSVDSKTAGAFQAAVMTEVTGKDKMILDLSGVSFLSSAGLRVLLMLFRQLKQQDGRLLLVNTPAEIQDIMSMTGFINFFDLYDSMELAEKQF